MSFSSMVTVPMPSGLQTKSENHWPALKMESLLIHERRDGFTEAITRIATQVTSTDVKFWQGVGFTDYESRTVHKMNLQSHNF